MQDFIISYFDMDVQVLEACFLNWVSFKKQPIEDNIYLQGQPPIQLQWAENPVGWVRFTPLFQFEKITEKFAAKLKVAFQPAPEPEKTQ